MANYASAQDIINSALKMVGELPDLTTSTTVASEYRATALEYLNQFHEAVLSGANEFLPDMGEPWSWARAPMPGVITLLPPTLATATLTASSASGAFTSVLPGSSQVGMYLSATGQGDVFQILTHNVGTGAFTLDGPWTAPTASYGVTLYKLDYQTLTGVLRLIAPFRVNRSQGSFALLGTDRNGMIEMSEMASMLQAYPVFALMAAVPNRFAIKSIDTAQNQITVRMNSSVMDLTRVEYDYIPIPADLTDSLTSFPVIPLVHRRVLAYGVAAMLASDKNDSREQSLLAKTTAGFNSMIKAEKRQRNLGNPDRARVVPRQDLTNRYRYWRGVWS